MFRDIWLAWVNKKETIHDSAGKQERQGWEYGLDISGTTPVFCLTVLEGV